MLDRDPRQLAIWGLAALALVLLCAWYLSRSAPDAGGAAPPSAPAAITVKDEPEGEAQVTVDVAGAVRDPGVYHLAAGQRVEDALERAGGATRRADLTQLNRAATLEDGRQILVPEKASKGGPAASAPGAARGAPVTGTQAGPASPSVNLNTATLQELDTLEGVGLVTAQKILDYRTEHNGFGSVDELDQIPGIGEVRLAALRERVTV
jgi:competence protein ComEA